MIEKSLAILPSLRKQTILTLVPRRWTLVSFLGLIQVMRFGFGLHLPYIMDILLLLWLGSSFPFGWIINRCKTPERLALIQFLYFFIELFILTAIIHLAGLTRWIGAMFYLYTIIYANILMTRNLARIVTISAMLLYSLLILAEWFGFLTQYPPLGLSSSDLYDPSLTVVLSVLLMLVAITTFESIGATIKDFVEHLRKREEDMHFLSIKYEDSQVSKEDLRKELMTTRMRAAMDGLTKLYNNGYFKHRLAVEFSLATLHGTSLAVVFLDLDNFKNYNDTHGHQAGDLALAAYAKVLKRSARTEDIASRYGGDEFTLLLPKTGLEEALRIVERIRAEVQADTNFKTPLTFSAGIAVFPLHGHSDEELLKIADTALYHAKGQGRNQTVVAQIQAQNPVPHHI